MARAWRNWTGDQRCRPARIERPRSRDELRTVVARAVADGLSVRVAGSGHSFSDVATTDGAMVRVEALNRVLDADPETGLVRVEAGIVLRDLSLELDRLGLAMANLGDIDRQTLAGAISTATHGTGARLPNISAQVEALELVLADGTVLEVSAGSDRDAYLAARVGLGALGALYSVTLRAVPAFNLHRLDEPHPVDETIERIDDLAAANDHFEFFVFPYTDRALRILRNRTDAPARPRGRLSAYVNEVLLENYLGDALSRVGRRFPSRIPGLTRLFARQMSHGEIVDRSFRMFANERRIRFTEMEYAVPAEQCGEAVRRVLELVRERALPVGFPIEFRVVAPDDALLSPAHERDTAYVAVHQYQGAEWRPYFEAVEAIMDSYGGRPHWGKRHFQTAETLAPRYPRWHDFQAVRDRLDPGRAFRNAYTDRVLGP